MLICDTHADTLYALADDQRDPSRPFDVTRAMLCQSGHTRVQAMALYVATGGMALSPTIVQRELCALERLKAQGFRQITQISEAKEGEANILLTIEGGEAFGDDPANVDFFADLGVRAAALTWNNENRLGFPAASGSQCGLTPFGHEVVRHMHARRMAVDISHLNERGADQLMDGPVPPMASHSCARALCDHPRNLTDRQLRKLFRAGGYVGVNFYARFLSDDGHADVDRVIDHMAHMCDLGGESFVGLGSDFDGIDAYPDGLRNAGDVPGLLDAMRQRGFGEALVEKIAGQNFKAYLERI